MNEVKEMQGFNVFDVLNVGVIDNDNKGEFMSPILKVLSQKISEEIQKAFFSGEFKGFHTFKFTLKTQVKKTDGNLDGFYDYEIHK